MTGTRVIALGFFDGVHVGHGALLRKTVELSKQLGVRASAMSFDVSPMQLITSACVPLLNSLEDREYLMKSLYGIDDFLIEHFDRAFMELSKEDFFDKILLQKYDACAVVCGHDYRFGYRGEGTAQTLSEFCKRHDIGCAVIDKVELQGQTVSSTNVRRLLQEGSFQKAVSFLGHPHVLSGAVQHGSSRGRSLGYPTANIPLQSGILTPPYGVYFGTTQLGGKTYPALCNVGVHPTVDRLDRPVLEVHIPDFNGELYGKSVRVKLYAFHRPEQTFSDIESLKSQLTADKSACLRYIKENHLDEA